MSQAAAMRSFRDRLIYTFTFEVTLVVMLIPAGMLFFEKGAGHIGVLALVLSLKAMLINLLYNWVFDRIDARSGRVASDRGVLGRMLHAVGFEVTLLITSLPIYMWWLDLTLLQAIMTDLVVTGFIVIYT